VLGKMAQTTLPRIPGRDFAGVVVAGPDPLVGQAVMGSGNGLGFTRDGSHAELLAVPAAALVPKPEELSFAEAAAVGVPFLTAWSAMVSAAGLRRGETALVFGIRGAVGGAAAQIARWQGAQAIGTVRGRSGGLADGWQAPPATLVIDLDGLRSLEDLPEMVHSMTSGRGADVVLDVVGGPMFELGLRCLAPRGRQVAIAATGEPRVSFNLADFYHREARLLGVDSLALGFDESRRVFEQLLSGFRDRSLTPPEVRPWPLADGVAAYRAVLAGRTGAKVVLVP
jgi:NADPH2:quinone reductase